MTAWPGVVIVHENAGLQEHFKDLARRYAKEGFVGLAVDLYSRWGGSPSAPDQPTISAAMGSVPIEQNAADVSEYVAYLTAQPDVLPGGVGLNGFCLGGGIAWSTAVQDNNVAAFVPYYGAPVPPAEKIPEMRAAVLALYGALDQRVNASIPQMEDALKASGKTYRMKIYEGAGHAFFNDSRNRYHQPSAEDAWAETLAWFRQYLPTALRLSQLS
jgi:carboxymethylenebutenolidase